MEVVKCVWECAGVVRSEQVWVEVSRRGQVWVGVCRCGQEWVDVGGSE